MVTGAPGAGEMAEMVRVLHETSDRDCAVSRGVKLSIDS